MNGANSRFYGFDSISLGPNTPTYDLKFCFTICYEIQQIYKNNVFRLFIGIIILCN